LSNLDEDKVARRAGHRHGNISIRDEDEMRPGVDVVISVTRHPPGLLMGFSLFVDQAAGIGRLSSMAA
jgi:hypothetical protein